uniref:Carbonic anhydrase 4 n=1 Tax=Nothoprocta perdicaria TaxID=30464 RepID=A0A8C6ZLK9_NOTPE
MSDLFRLFVCLFACGGHWCYQSQKYKQPSCEGTVEQWYLINNTCKESKQSPINIVTKNVIYDDSLKPLNFEGYDVQGSSKWNIENNGHTGTAEHPALGKACGGLKRKYKAIELHFHWGVQDIHYLPGSEHSIDGEKTAMELLGNACFGINIFPFQVGDENKKYAPLINELDNIKYKGKTFRLLKKQRIYILSTYATRYYRYIGSLTTPDCHEGVIWTVFEKPVALSLAQVSQFSMVYFGGKNSTTHMVENFRPVQPLNDRSIYWSGASLPQPSARVLMLLSVLTYILSSLLQ